MGLSVIIITKNEEKDLLRALNSVSFADEVIVLDSGSTDGTQKIAKDWGAQVFETVDWPGFGPQKNRALDRASQDWILSLDADEWIEPNLAEELRRQISPELTNQPEGPPSAFRLRRRSTFIDRVINFGDWRNDRVIRLFRRGFARFSEDLVHERVIVDGRVEDLKGFMGHFSVRNLEDARSKMWNYNRTAAVRIAQKGRGGVQKGFAKALFSSFRGLVLRAGFLDGTRGFQLAWFNAYGTYLRYALAKEIQLKNIRVKTSQPSQGRFRDYLELFIFDHGFLRALYSNRFRLPGGIYRSNQPSPRQLELYKRRYGIKTVINLRGRNDQLGWYRLESEACKRLDLELINIQVYSRGLVEKEKLDQLRDLIQKIELPALVHCKSGADRAGFFSVLYSHFRTGEPIEHAMSQLGIKYGHVSAAKTGILDHMFLTYLSERNARASFQSWYRKDYNKGVVENSFSSPGIRSYIFDAVIRRE